ncbi:MAG: hypothetical protein J07HB67_01705 [halophilic archaeon J07HB67]|jgi:hypothetical protein|nr:MAG: hypothetical protein J07HB67_01705 [halophilic archaeon J07HB67]
MVRFGPAIDPPSDGTESTLLGGAEDVDEAGTEVSLDELLAEIGVEEP